MKRMSLEPINCKKKHKECKYKKDCHIVLSFKNSVTEMEAELQYNSLRGSLYV